MAFKSKDLDSNSKHRQYKQTLMLKYMEKTNKPKLLQKEIAKRILFLIEQENTKFIRTIAAYIMETLCNLKLTLKSLLWPQTV